MAAEVLDGETVRRWPLPRAAGARAPQRRGGSGPRVPAAIEGITQAGSDVPTIPNAPRLASLATPAAARSGAGPDVEAVCYQAGPVPLPVGAE
jgi:hypothetical protein